MKKQIEKLKEIAEKAQRAYLDAEEKRKNDEILPLLRKMKGKCFKYNNSYGSDLPRWWLYAKVVDVDESKYQLKTVEFQRTSIERVEVYLGEKISFNGEIFFGGGSGYYPITRSEYNREAKKMKKFIIDKLDA